MPEPVPGILSKAPPWSLFVFWLIAAAPLAAERPASVAVASAHPLATEAGLEVLAAGGNAFDAAVAVSAALAVVEPYGSGVGGGGFWLLHRALDRHEVMIDGRERAPLAATPDMYLDASGAVIPGASIDGPLAAGIPGMPAALVHIARHYGRLPLRDSLAASIRLAREGFAVDPAYRRMAAFRLPALRASAAATAQFLVDGGVPPQGHLLRQPDLADTLASIAEDDAGSFYDGRLAAQMVAAVRADGGIWSLDDLRSYRVIERAPIVVRHRGGRVVSASLPSSGGIVLAQMLQMLDALPAPGSDPVDRVHLLVEVMRRAYADRARHLGDADHVAVPQARLLSADYAARRAATIDPVRATPSEALPEPSGSGRDTTHFSILDSEGNRVAATLSINYPFGAGYVVPGTGVLLNDEMDDFSAGAGLANAYGLLGSQANAIAPGKRMLSSMSPTFVEHGQRVVLLGTPGGSRIISMLLLAVLDVFEGAPVDAIVARGRFHHQYMPDRIEAEAGALSTAALDELQARGHHLRVLDADYGNMQAVAWDRRSGEVTAASDPRGIGSSRVVAPVRDVAVGRAMAE